MISGTYSINLKTPLGIKKGELTLEENGGTLTGKMNALGRETAIGPGTCAGDSFTFSGSFKTAVGKLDYICTGTVGGDTLNGIAKTKKGDLTLKGTRKA